MKIKDKNNLVFSYLVVNGIYIFLSNAIQFSLSLYVLDFTKSGLVFATVLSVVIVPRLLLTPVAGVIADFYSKKKIIVFSIIFNMFSLLFFLIPLNNNNFFIIAIYAFVISQEIVEIFFTTTIATYLPIIVEDSLMDEVNSISSIIENTILVLVPLGASFFYSKIDFQVMILFFFIMLLCMIPFIKRLPSYNIENDEKPPSILNLLYEIKTGIDYIRTDIIIRRLCFIIPLSNLFVTPIFTVTIMYFLRQQLEVESTYIGLVYAISSFVSIFAPLSCMKIIKKFKSNNVIFYSYIGITLGLAIIMYALLAFKYFNLPSIFILALIISGVVCTEFFSSISGVLESSYVKKNISMKYLGRVISVINLLATIFYPFGELTYGSILDYYPAYLTLAISLGGMILNIVLSGKVFLSSDDAK